MATNVTGQAVVFNHKTTRVNALSSTQKNVIYFTTDGHIVLDNRDYTPEYQPLINAGNKLSYSLISGLGTAAGKGFTDEFSANDEYDELLPSCAAVKAYVKENQEGFARYLGHVYNEGDVDALTEKANPGDYVVAVSSFTLNEESVAMDDLVICVPVPLPTSQGRPSWGKGWLVYPRVTSGGGESGGGGLYWD